MYVYIYSIYHFHTYRAHFHIVLQSFLLFSLSCSYFLCLTSVHHLSPFLSFTRASFFICHSHSLIFSFNHSLTHHFLSIPPSVLLSLCVLDISGAPLSFFSPYIYITVMKPVVLILKHHWKQAGYNKYKLLASSIYTGAFSWLFVLAWITKKKPGCQGQAARLQGKVWERRQEKREKKAKISLPRPLAFDKTKHVLQGQGTCWCCQDKCECCPHSHTHMG